MTNTRTGRDYFQLGRSQLLHIVIDEINAEATLCQRDIDGAVLANDVEDQPICTHCMRALRKLEK